MPDAQRERPQALERVEEVRVAGRLPDEVVDALVEAHVGVDPERALDRDELGVEPRGARAVGVGHAPGRQPRRLRLELRAHLGDVDDVGRVDVRDVGARARADLDEALEREPLDRLAERRPAEAEVAHELLLAQRGPRREAQRDDEVAHRDVGPIGDQAAVARRRLGGLTPHESG